MKFLIKEGYEFSLTNKRILIAGGLPDSLINFRGDLISAILKRGCDITAMSAPASKTVIKKLEQKGVVFKAVSLRRNSFSVVFDLVTSIQFVCAFLKYKPSKVLAYTIKPVIWGGVASRLTTTPFYALITGLGYAFHGDSVPRRVLTSVIKFLYRLALSRAKAVMFQNEDNAKLFIELGLVRREQVYVVNGSGVNTDYFDYREICLDVVGAVEFLCIARLLGDKGLREYAEAASIVKMSYPAVKFILVGPEDCSPDGISLEEVCTWEHVNYLGGKEDVRPYIESSHVYVLPSYHEGLPRSSLEAMSMGRPVITTNAVGCKDTVVDNWNGFKVDVGCAQQLAEKMIWCIENAEKLKEMGENSRKFVEEKFDVNMVNHQIIEAMGIDE